MRLAIKHPTRTVASYSWTIEGVKKRVCPHCNQSLERKQSKAAMKRYL